MAEKNGVHAGWSNPCCDRFADKFEKVTGQKYYKNDRDVYGKLVQYGDFGQAVVLAERSLKKCVDDGKKQPSGIWLLNAFCGNCDKCGERIARCCD